MTFTFSLINSTIPISKTLELLINFWQFTLSEDSRFGSFQISSLSLASGKSTVFQTVGDFHTGNVFFLFCEKKFKTRTFLLNLTSFWILQIMRYLGSLRISLRHSQRNFTQNEEEMFSFQDLNSNYKRILQYLVSMRIFAFSVIICYSC